jgi:hypothetical protein
MEIQLTIHSWDLGDLRGLVIRGSSLFENPYIPYQYIFQAQV